MMTPILTIILLAVAVSIDSFTVAFTYGLRKVTLSLRAILLIGMMSCCIFLSSMIIGHTIALFISVQLADWFGGFLLICLGALVLRSVFQKKGTTIHQAPRVWKIEIKTLGVVIQILKKPLTADLDQSGHITGMEVVVLAMALSIDSFGAGIGAALVGLPTVASAISIGAATSLFLFLGLQTGKQLSSCNKFVRINMLPGILLIIIGIIRMIG